MSILIAWEVGFSKSIEGQGCHPADTTINATTSTQVWHLWQSSRRVTSYFTVAVAIFNGDNIQQIQSQMLQDGRLCENHREGHGYLRCYTAILLITARNTVFYSWSCRFSRLGDVCLPLLAISAALYICQASRSLIPRSFPTLLRCNI